MIGTEGRLKNEEEIFSSRWKTAFSSISLFFRNLCIVSFEEREKEEQEYSYEHGT